MFRSVDPIVPNLPPDTRTFWQKFRHRLATTIYVLIAVLAALFLMVLIVAHNEGPAKPPYTIGVTFRFVEAQALGLDWKQTYDKMLDELHFRNIRIPVYWDDVEKKQGTFDFSNVDFQVHEAETRDAKVILAVGRRVPGWPECHIPDWAASQPADNTQPDLINEITATVERYKNSPALQYWQVENEPYLVTFGTCPKYNFYGDLNDEIALVRKLDPNHPIIVTENGEVSIWVIAAYHADVFATTIYRRVFIQHLNRYGNYHFPPLFYQFKKGLVHLFMPDKTIWDLELQGEPWTTHGTAATPFAEQAITLPPGSLHANLKFAEDSGFSVNYFWGVEYWYWAAAHGHPEFLNEAKDIMNGK